MTELRTIDMTLAKGEDTTAGEVMQDFIEQADSAFLGDVVTFGKAFGENPEVAPASLSFKTDADPDAMKLEAEFFAGLAFDQADGVIVPTDEEMEEAIPDFGNPEECDHDTTKEVYPPGQSVGLMCKDCGDLL